MPLSSFSRAALPLVEDAILNALQLVRSPGTGPLFDMLVYHLGLEAGLGNAPARGKRIRPLLVLLCCGAAGPGAGSWRKALPSAAAVELLHNFSLIHDDIQDESPTRRGRASVWVRWGVPQAINAGDAMYTLAFHVLQDQGEISGPEAALKALRLFQNTCLALTGGQYLDLDFENRSEVSLEEYWAMIGGKTAALLSACTELGSLAAGVGEPRRTAFREFGRNLGLAFQIQDDLLGVWGDESQTGKSAAADLTSGKKTLPILYGLSQNGEFARLWRSGQVQPADAAGMADLLEEEGGRSYTEAQVLEKTQKSLQFLNQAAPSGKTGAILSELAEVLIKRRS